METPQRVEASPHMPEDEDNDVSQSEHSSMSHLDPSSQHGTSQEQSHPRLTTDDLEHQRLHSLDLEFQDSNLSPALFLMPVNSGVEPNLTEYSLFQQSDNEFAPLRAYPDVSMASERFHSSLQGRTSQASESGSLFQHPLAQTTILSEEATSSCCSLSLYSLPPVDKARQEEIDHSLLTAITDRQEALKKDSETQSDRLAEEALDDDTYFLSKDIPAQHLLELLEKDVGVPNTSSSAVSSASEVSVKKTVSKSTNVCKSDIHQSQFRRERPPGEASLPEQQAQQADQSRELSSEVSNITMGSRSTRPDTSSEMLHRELLSEVTRHSNLEAESRNQPLLGPCVTPYPTKASEEKNSATVQPSTGPFSAGVERLHREQDIWSSGNQTGIDGSYLGFLPQSQSTPGVFKAPPKSSVKATLGRLSAIESDKEDSNPSSSRISPQPAISERDVHHPGTASQCREENTSAKVQSLPSLNYMQKVDAWRANHSSCKTSLFDSLALQGFSGVSPKKKAYDAVSDSLNRILSEHLQSAATQNVTQSPSDAPSTSVSPRRGEAVGRAPSDKDNLGSAARPSNSPFGMSQSHSSLNTVVMSSQKDKETGQAQLSPLLSLGHFSDVSDDRNLTLSSSQESYNSGLKLGTSIGASSIISLEVDNYAPFWTSRPPSTPPQLNIDERIPLYLHNLGIDQSPSTILTPFAPRGPIREPEFSPTDICTIKGSIGTPTKSTQPSEAESPHKGEFSRCSVLSVDSSISIPLSLDSLAPALSMPDQTRRTSPSTDTQAFQSECRQEANFHPDEDCRASILQPTRQQQHSSLISSQSAVQVGKRSDLSLFTKPRCTQKDFELPLRSNCSLDKSREDSFVGSKALSNLQKELSQADNVVSARSSAASSASAAKRHLLSDGDIFLSSMKKTSKPQDSSFSSSAAEDRKTRSSSLWTRSSSDSMLTSDNLRQSSMGQESVASSWQPDYPSTSAVVTAPSAGSVLSKSARRAEPEGCSAAPPDSTVPTQPAQQLTSAPAEPENASVEEQQAALGDASQSNSSSAAPEDTDQGVLSDGSSESSLAARVAELLQREPPATMMSSTASSTDQEESRAREWIKQKLSGRQCEPLELDEEDKKRIEEITRELLLKYPMKSQLSTDTDSSAVSSVRVPNEKAPPTSAETFTDPADLNRQLAPPLSGIRTHLVDSHVPHSSETLEAQVQKIAAREGVTLTSISISDCRRSTSPSPSPSPVPAISPSPELSTEAAEHPQTNKAPTTDPTSVFDPPSNVTSHLMSGNQKRREAVCGHDASQGLRRKDLNVKDYLRVHNTSDSGQTCESLTRSGHVSHVHVTLSPKATDRSSATQAEVLSGLTRREFISLRRSPSAASSPDEGAGLSSPAEWREVREPQKQRTIERVDTSTLFKTAAPQERMTSTSKQTFTPHLTPDVSKRPVTSELPVLLPYKPHGSEDFFYVPQLEADVSSSNTSDTTMESSHTGSDDAVPPRFSSDVLGHQDPGLDRGVTIRHTEGIYSKRSKTATFKMQESGHRDKSSQTSVNQTPKRVSVRDQGTSPVHFFHHDDPQTTVFIKTRRHVNQSSADLQERDHDDPHPQHSSSSNLEQLWQRFCEQRNMDDSRPTSDREASLLERLELLSRFIHSKRAANVSGAQEERRDANNTKPKQGKSQDSSSFHTEVRGMQRKVGGSGKFDPRQAWTQTLQPQPAEEDSRASSTSALSHSSSQSLGFTPADRDESETTSTIDTDRLVRVFGTRRVQNQRSSSSLSKLYKTINKQKEGREQRRGRRPPSETEQSSILPDSTSSTFTVSSERGLSGTLTVKLLSKGIQTASDLEIVSNGTLRHTRDVGTTFPSPHESRAPRHVFTSSSRAERGRGGRGGNKTPSKCQSSHKQRKNKRSPSKFYPAGVSWFVSADDLRSEARKENQEEEEEEAVAEWRPGPSTAMFVPYSRTRPWREPLRLRQVHEDRNLQHHLIHHHEPHQHSRTKTTSSGLTQVSLQEALAMRRPDFISRSMQRLKRLTLQVEKRKLHNVFTGERDEAGGAVRLKPAGAALLRRAVPRKEMIQRSKLIYESLPEVQRRKEEERRKAEYKSYRLNAQLYNKRITNHVLGRRTAWQ
ncbi:hypothetical protein JOB18_007338 [Solea senegalensis]|uniref:ALMS motif domain-containing protein n=1 Tax=Solea senegalensis TaxID=28829 RepID=A0AAV6RWZ5_SOLSE|nr:mucin-5AC isoform X2 [Solea senegalensis]KAG7509890.1 hypothetical protein JOB18_007338 [Solea senegalensis]